MFRPLEIIAPEGTVVHGAMPAASSMRGVTGFRLVDTVLGALSGLLPDRVMAAGEGGNSLVVFGGARDDGEPYVYYELMSGTWGGRPDRDGNDGLCNPANVASNIPVEQAESEYPIRIERYGYVPDSGGAGTFRGGLGLEREWRLLSGEAHLAIRSDRRRHPPYGLYGGRPGRPSHTVLHREGGEEVLPTMISTRIGAGERVHHRQAGGGGWGDPLGRDPRAVVDDVRNGKVSAEAARREHGVVLVGGDGRGGDGGYRGPAAADVGGGIDAPVADSARRRGAAAAWRGPLWDGVRPDVDTPGSTRLSDAAGAAPAARGIVVGGTGAPAAGVPESG